MIERVRCSAPMCLGGQTSGLWWLQSFVRLMMLAGADVRNQASNPGLPRHPYLQHLQRLCVGYPLSADFTDLTTGLAGRRPHGPIGHDTIDALSAARKIATAAGLPDTWGICQVCKGNGWIDMPRPAPPQSAPDTVRQKQTLDLLYQIECGLMKAPDTAIMSPAIVALRELRSVLAVEGVPWIPTTTAQAPQPLPQASAACTQRCWPRTPSVAGFRRER